MSFFGFDASLPRDRKQNTAAPGFGARQDPFAGLSQATGGEDDGINFEDTYDGLGDQLDESADAFNADTFGGVSSIGKDFDFSGQTSHMADTMSDEHVLYNARGPATRANPPRQQPKPTRTGYEKYSQPEYIPNLVASESIWGTAPKKPVEQHQDSSLSLGAATKKMMSLEEVEAAMRSGKGMASSMEHTHSNQADLHLQQSLGHGGSVMPQRQQGNTMPFEDPAILQQQTHNRMPSRPTGILHPMPQQQMQGGFVERQMPAQVFNEPVRSSPHIPQRMPISQPLVIPQVLEQGPTYSGRSLAQDFSNEEQVAAPTSEAALAILREEESKRARRNHKIQVLSRDNGVMTPQDKNFITRIQLQQLLSATGNVDNDPSVGKAEDFYFEVFCQIRAPPRQDPSQPLNQFAQAYLGQTFGRGSRRYPIGGQNQMRRMEQQVQRAVEAARNRPKVSALNIEGSLGKISFSNAKTPKPLLNIKRTDATDGNLTNASRLKAGDDSSQKAALANVEAAYDALMEMEDHERRMPPNPREDSMNAGEVEALAAWRQRLDSLNGQLWNRMKVHAPIDPSASTMHPFIAMLSHSKGKKLVPRAFRQLSEQQRLTILTMIVLHLDRLDVVEHASVYAESGQLPPALRDQIDIFQQAISPCFFGMVNEAPLHLVTNLIELIVDRTNLQIVIRSKVGVSLMTMLTSRAEIVKQSGQAPTEQVQGWNDLFDSIFGKLEPNLTQMFPTNAKAGDEVYAWQFLAALGIGASPDQQQRLVLAVKDQVMDTIGYARTLPQDIAQPKLDNVNLFMTAIGLDVSMLG